MATNNNNVLDALINEIAARILARRDEMANSGEFARSDDWPYIRAIAADDVPLAPPARPASTPDQVARRGTVPAPTTPDRRKAVIPPKPKAKSAKSVPDERQAERRTNGNGATLADRATMAKKASPARDDGAEAARYRLKTIDEAMKKLRDGETLEIDLTGHTPAFKSVFINAINKGMPAIPAYNWTARKIYGEGAPQY